VGIREVAVNEMKWLPQRLDVLKVFAFDARIVKIIQIVKSPDLVAIVQQAFADVRADEARAAGDEKIHAAR